MSAVSAVDKPLTQPAMANRDPDSAPATDVALSARRWRRGALLLLMWLAAIGVLAQVAALRLNPRDLGLDYLPLLLVPIGAWHASRFCRSSTTVLAYGIAAALLIVVHEFPDYHGWSWFSYETAATWPEVRFFLIVFFLVKVAGYVLLAMAGACGRWYLPQFTFAHRVETQRRQLGLCVKCGYDLCATPERCPECGTVVAPEVPQRVD